MKYILLLFLMAFTHIVLGQPGDPGGEPVPITGIEILLAAGGLFGAKKLYDNGKNSK